MKNLTLAALLCIASSIVVASTAFAATAPVPCEKMLSDVRAAVKNAKLDDPDQGKVEELEQKGIERCSADDDSHADAFFAEALKIIGK
jgi:hypothetical protein